MNRLHERHLGNISGTMMECDLEIALSLERRRRSGSGRVFFFFVLLLHHFFFMFFKFVKYFVVIPVSIPSEHGDYDASRGTVCCKLVDLLWEFITMSTHTSR